MVAMESLIMQESKESDKKIKGLETMDYQLGIFDKIPYKLQAKQLYEMIAKSGDTAAGNELTELTEIYSKQQLLLYKRNENWAKKLSELMPEKSLVVAVGAGHLPGKRGVINLLRQAGYKVEPVKNEMVKKGKEI